MSWFSCVCTHNVIEVLNVIIAYFCLRQESMFSLGACVRVRPSVRPNEFVDSKTLGSIGATPAKFGTHTPGCHRCAFDTELWDWPGIAPPAGGCVQNTFLDSTPPFLVQKSRTSVHSTSVASKQKGFFQIVYTPSWLATIGSQSLESAPFWTKCQNSSTQSAISMKLCTYIPTRPRKKWHFKKFRSASWWRYNTPRVCAQQSSGTVGTSAAKPCTHIPSVPQMYLWP